MIAGPSDAPLRGRRGAALRRHRPATPPGREVVLVTCMDFRVMDAIGRYMESRGLAENYDHIVLAGASLGAQTRRFPAWSQTFWEHLDLANKRYPIRRVIVIDHRDCGAYREILGASYAQTREAETQVHAQHLRGLGQEIRQRHPQAQVELLLMDLNGQVEPVAAI